MSETDRIIGKLEEFKNSAETRLGNIETEIKNLNNFKIRVTAYAAAAFIGSKFIWELGVLAIGKILTNSGH